MDKENEKIDFDDLTSSIDENISLESILAEYKGSAYINGDKKTPSEILNAKTEQIILEVTNEANTEGSISAEQSDETDTGRSTQNVENEQLKLKINAESDQSPKDTFAEQSEIPRKPDYSIELKDDDVKFFESFGYAQPAAVEEFLEEVTEAIESESRDEDTAIENVKSIFNFFAKSKVEKTKEIEDEVPIEEPDYLEAAKLFAQGSHSLTMRTAAAFILCIIMAVFTYVFEGGNSVPFGIGTNLILLTGILLIMQLLVMLLGVDILIRGVNDLVRAEPGAETLLVVSSIFIGVSAVYTIISDTTTAGLPFCAVASFSIMFAMWGEKKYRTAMKESLRTAVAASRPYGVSAEFGQLGQRTILKKSAAQTAGFYTNLVQADITERVYNYAAPLFLIASLIFAILSSIGHGQPQYFAYFFAAILSVTASFSSIFAFASPFSAISKRAKRSGAAIAGWAGACEIYYSDGALITDDDIFPVGTLTINGLKVFQGIDPEKVMKYTASLIIASGSGLSKPFADMLKTQGYSLVRLDDFACYEGGGIGAIIRGERVLTGTAGFMNLMGIRVPSSVNMKNAIFTAINDELIGVISVNYVPVNSVKGALISILRARVNMLFAMRDFNITPLMLQQKFKVSMDGIEYVPIQDSYRITEENLPGTGNTAAVLCREGLWPFAEAITSGRQLKTISQLTTIITIIGSVIGILFMFFLCWNASFKSASPGNTLIYMLSIHIAVIIVGSFARRKN